MAGDSFPTRCQPVCKATGPRQGGKEWVSGVFLFAGAARCMHPPCQRPGSMCRTVQMSASRPAPGTPAAAGRAPLCCWWWWWWWLSWRGAWLPVQLPPLPAACTHHLHNRRVNSDTISQSWQGCDIKHVAGGGKGVLEHEGYAQLPTAPVGWAQDIILPDSTCIKGRLVILPMGNAPVLAPSCCRRCTALFWSVCRIGSLTQRSVCKLFGTTSDTTPSSTHATSWACWRAAGGRPLLSPAANQPRTGMQAPGSCCSAHVCCSLSGASPAGSAGDSWRAAARPAPYRAATASAVQGLNTGTAASAALSFRTYSMSRAQATQSEPRASTRAFERDLCDQMENTNTLRMVEFILLLHADTDAVKWGMISLSMAHQVLPAWCVQGAPQPALTITTPHAHGRCTPCAWQMCCTGYGSQRS
jgi:hypothetical protein